MGGGGGLQAGGWRRHDYTDIVAAKGLSALHLHRPGHPQPTTSVASVTPDRKATRSVRCFGTFLESCCSKHREGEDMPFKGKGQSSEHRSKSSSKTVVVSVKAVVLIAVSMAAQADTHKSKCGHLRWLELEHLKD